MIKSNLSKILGERRIKMSQLSRETGLAINTIAAIYYGRCKQIQFETINKVCRSLNIGIGDLFEYIPDDSLNP